MDKTEVSQLTNTQPNGKSFSRWFVRFGESVPNDVPGFECHLVAGEGRSQKLVVGNQIGCLAPRHFAGAGCHVIFDGFLVNAKDLQHDLGQSSGSNRNNAEIIWAAYQRLGEDCLRRLRGSFALVIWDSLREVLLYLRDPLGSHPLFCAEAGKDLVISPSVDVLLQQPGVSRRLNRVMLVAYLAQRFEKSDETFFEAVTRVPMRTVVCLTPSGRRTYQYWDPVPDGEVKWLTPNEVGRFDEVFDQAVSRCLSVGPASMFLSGGLDSVSVAALAVERSRQEGLPKPWALSLVFPHPETDEQVLQTSVAEQLGVPQVLKPFFEATGENGLLGPAFSLSRSLSAPLLNVWLPAYYELAREGKQRGCDVILTGNGGDEWLTVGPFISADLVRALDLVGFYKLWQSHRRSYRLSEFHLLRNLLWRYGAAPIVMPPVHRVVKRWAPWSIKLRHRWALPDWMPPRWVAPDAGLRAQLIHRMEESAQQQQQATGSFYDKAGKVSLDHLLRSWELEELFEVYSRLKMRVLHPFWDADLVDLLYRTPPFMLNSGGRTKGLVRDSLARRFPKLGFERQRKVLAMNFFHSLVAQDAQRLWEQLRGAPILASLGVVDESWLHRNWGAPRNSKDRFRIWSVLNLESWAGGHLN